jgi:hypothetical protein
VAALCGDYNITATGPYKNPTEHANLSSTMEGFADLWVEEHGGGGDSDQSIAPSGMVQNTPLSQAFTFDTTVNTMLHGHEHARYDRVMMRLPSDDIAHVGGGAPDITAGVVVGATITGQDATAVGTAGAAVVGNDAAEENQMLSIRIVGNKPIKPGMFISDHFGLAFSLPVPMVDMDMLTPPPPVHTKGLSTAYSKLTSYFRGT